MNAKQKVHQKLIQKNYAESGLFCVYERWCVVGIVFGCGRKNLSKTW